jgi:hypothetical protein
MNPLSGVSSDEPACSWTLTGNFLAIHCGPGAMRRSKEHYG